MKFLFFIFLGAPLPLFASTVTLQTITTYSTDKLTKKVSSVLMEKDGIYLNFADNSPACLIEAKFLMNNNISGFDMIEKVSSSDQLVIDCMVQPGSAEHSQPTAEIMHFEKSAPPTTASAAESAK